MIIKYKCYCMQDEVDLVVQDRRADQDIIEWMEETVRPALTKDHQQRNAACMSQKMEYVKIPVFDELPVGNKPREH